MKTWISGSGGIELIMTLDQAKSVFHSGQCDLDADALTVIPAIKKQLDKIDNRLLAKELSEYGVWDDTQLANNVENRLRLVWIAGCDIAESEDC